MSRPRSGGRLPVSWALLTLGLLLLVVAPSFVVPEDEPVGARLVTTSVLAALSATAGLVVAVRSLDRTGRSRAAAVATVVAAVLVVTACALGVLAQLVAYALI